jgi:hypothetical protein
VERRGSFLLEDEHTPVRSPSRQLAGGGEAENACADDCGVDPLGELDVVR